MVVPGDWGRGRVESQCLTGTEFQFYKKKRTLELYGCGAAQQSECTNITELYTQKWLRSKFYKYFTTIKTLFFLMH